MHRQAGFTIVEMMVGVLIGMIAIVVMFQVMMVSESQKRTTAGAGEAQQNGVTSLYLMERDARIAGYGLGYLPLLGCLTTGYHAPTATKFQFRMVPVFIVNGSGGVAPDKVTFLYSDTSTFQLPAAAVNATAPSKGGTVGFVRVPEAKYQFDDGDLMIMGEAPFGNLAANPLANPPIAVPCTLLQVTRQVNPESLNDIHYDDPFYKDDSGTTHPADFNPPGGIMPAPDGFGYTAWSETRRSGGRVTNLGHEPTLMEYSLVNDQLVARNLFKPADPPVIVSDGIVQFQAQYGYSSLCPWYGAPLTVAWNPMPVNPPAGYQPACQIDSAAGNVPMLNTVWPPIPGRDQWADDLVATTMTPQNWRQVVAMRFVLVARSTNMEKKNPTTGVCDATTVMPVWTANNQTLNLGADPDWRCYRYRKYEGIVPVRNMMWVPDPLGSSVPPA
jgi:type IV pilus assembly protein PilW